MESPGRIREGRQVCNCIYCFTLLLLQHKFLQYLIHESKPSFIVSIGQLQTLILSLCDAGIDQKIGC